MSLKRFFIALFIAVAFFIAGVLVGRFVMPKEIHITVIDVKDLVEVIERYNEAKWELERIKEWNEQAITEPEQAEEDIGSEEPEDKTKEVIKDARN